MKQLKNHLVVLATLSLCLVSTSIWTADQGNSDAINETVGAANTTEDSIQLQALEQREILLEQLNQAQWLLSQPNHSEANIDQEILVQQLEAAQQQLSMASDQLANTYGGQETGNMLQQLLDLIRAQLTDEEPVVIDSDTQSEFALFAQHQIDEARAQLEQLPDDINKMAMLKQLDNAQEKLEEAKNEINSGVE